MIAIDSIAIIYALEGLQMKMERVIIQIPKPIKEQLEQLRSKGYTASGYIRGVLKRELNQLPTKKQKGR